MVHTTIYDVAPKLKVFFYKKIINFSASNAKLKSKKKKNHKMYTITQSQFVIRVLVGRWRWRGKSFVVQYTSDENYISIDLDLRSCNFVCGLRIITGSLMFMRQISFY